METLNLPQYTTPFIGREVELADIGKRLREPNCRLLTLVGPGGIGKTRLAVEAVLEIAPIFQDGLFFVALQPVESVRSIVRTVGSAIGFEFSSGSEPDLQLHRHLHERDALLILDNLEHLPGASDIIANLLKATSLVKLLVTSREPLSLYDEWLYHVEGLPFPDQESANNIDTYDAVRLYADHASRVQRDFSLDAEQAAVVRVCRLVEGMPLGIELAASWQRRLPAVEIAQELYNSLDILQTDIRDVPDRHRSMRAVFDHSWKLLSEEERRVFRALSVFRGGFRRDAAEEIAGATLPILMSLVDKSMLKVNRHGRYEIHELLRQYAASKLGEVPESETAIRDLHSAYYTAFINRPVIDFLGARNQETLQAIDVEIENFRAAWNWTIAHRNLSNLNQALNGLYWYAWMRSWHEEAEGAFREAVIILRAAEPSRANLISLGQALMNQAAMDIWLGHPARAFERAQESESIVRPLGRKEELAGALHIQGWAAMAEHNWQQAKTLIEDAVVLYIQADHSDQYEFRAFAYGQLGYIDTIEGDLEAAGNWYQKALKLGRERKDQRTIAEALQNLGRLAKRQGKDPLARQYLEESLQIARTARFLPFIVGTLWKLGGIAMESGHLEEARDYFEEGLDIAKEDGKSPSIGWSHFLLAELLIAQGEHEAAQKHLQKTLEIPPGIADRSRYAAVQGGWGRIALQTGAYAEACKHFEASCALYREIQDDAGIITNLVLLARATLAQMEEDQAKAFLLESLQSANKYGSPSIILQVIVGIAELFMRQEYLTDAVRLASLVAQHPASSAESKDLASIILNAPQAAQISINPNVLIGQDSFTDLTLLGEKLVTLLAAQSTQPLVESLSARELQVLRLVAAGRSNREIAQELVLAVGTVKSHIHNILQKLNVSSRMQAVARARYLHIL